MILPFEIMSRVASVWASKTGLRNAGSMGTAPILILLVCAANAAIVVRQSPRALSNTVTLSPNQIWSNPSSSACAASDHSCSKLFAASSCRMI